MPHDPRFGLAIACIVGALIAAFAQMIVNMDKPPRRGPPPPNVPMFPPF